MALSTITRGQARSDVRSRLGNVTSETLVDDELNYWLSLAQTDIASRLSAISAQWYGEEKVDLAIASATSGGVKSYVLSDPAPSVIMKPLLVVGTAGIFDGELIPWSRLEDLYSYVNMTTYSNHLSVALHGASLYFFVGEDLTPTAGDEVSFFYIRKPTAIFGGATTDSTVLDIPEEYVDLVVMHAQGKAYQKLGNIQSKADVDQDVNARLNDVRQSFAQDMQIFQAEKPLGQQTPRLR